MFECDRAGRLFNFEPRKKGAIGCAESPIVLRVGMKIHETYSAVRNECCTKSKEHLGDVDSVQVELGMREKSDMVLACFGICVALCCFSLAPWMLHQRIHWDIYANSGLAVVNFAQCVKTSDFSSGGLACASGSQIGVNSTCSGDLGSRLMDLHQSQTDERLGPQRHCHGTWTVTMRILPERCW